MVQNHKPEVRRIDIDKTNKPVDMYESYQLGNHLYVGNTKLIVEYEGIITVFVWSYPDQE